MPNYSTTVRNARMEVVNTNSSGGKLSLYDGVKPAPGGAATTLIAEFDLATPAGTVSSAVLTFTDPADTTVDATGTVTWARITNSSGVFVADFTCSDVSGTGEIKLTMTSLTAGQVLNVTALSITEGDA